jgi:radical SAM protein with 4Fe4S-binding SPASM domain
MIDDKRLQQAYDRHGFYSLQLEVGDVCHQGCVYCYMNALETPVNTLSDEDIRAILHDAAALDMTAIEWLGGEPLLRESIFGHMAVAAGLGLRNNVWTGGLPLADPAVRGPVVEHARHGLISVHVSTVDPGVYRKLHPAADPANLYRVLDSVQAVVDMDYPTGQMLNSVTFTGLQTADDMIRTIDAFEERWGIRTSLNVYHTYLRPGSDPGDLERFIPDPEAVRRVYERYARQWGVDEFPMNCVDKRYCSATFAVLCDGSVTPCATVREPRAPSIHGQRTLAEIVTENRDHLNIEELRDPASLPPGCRSCRMNDACFGCRSRAYAADRGLYGRDPRCYGPRT